MAKSKENKGTKNTKTAEPSRKRSKKKSAKKKKDAKIEAKTTKKSAREKFLEEVKNDVKEEEFGFEENERITGKGVNTGLLIITAVLMVSLIMLLVYHAQTVDLMRDNFREKIILLEETQAEMLKYRGEYEQALKDLQIYDEIYEEQETEIESSKDAALLEYYFDKNLIDRSCIAKQVVPFSDSTTIVISARGVNVDGWPTLHIMLDGKYMASYEISSDKYTDYVIQLDMPRQTHHIDLIYNNDHLNREEKKDRNLYIERITLNGNEVEKDSGFYDAGKGVSAFDCEKQRKNWDMVSNGALRFRFGRS